MAISGERVVEVGAPRADVLAALLDVEAYPDWQPDVKEAEVLERDGEGRPLESEVVQDAQVRKIRARVRYEHHGEEGFSWSLVKGDVKDLRGSYVLEESGPSATRVTYALEVDPGRALGMILRGPVVDRVRDHVMDGTLKALKAHVER
jgi:ribosome-associated toxin RatA of RatAB toxin-antitoxin module